MQSDHVYDQLVEYYDWEHAEFLDDLPMYSAYASATGGEILDAACGTGRLLIPLGRAGHTVTGVDNSASMVDRASSKIRAQRLQKRVHLVLGDLRSLELGRRFGLAFVALGSFHHLLSAVDQRSALQGLWQHLEPGGLLVLDLVNPTPEWLAAADGALVHQLTRPFPTGAGPDLASKFVARSGAFEVQTDRQLLLYDRVAPDGSIKRSAFEMEMRFAFRFEAEMLVNAAGFRVRDLYGGYGMEPYDAASQRMILVAEKS